MFSARSPSLTLGRSRVLNPRPKPGPECPGLAPSSIYMTVRYLSSAFHTSPHPIWTPDYLLTHPPDGRSQRTDWSLDHRPLQVGGTHSQVSSPPTFERVGGDILLIIGMINRSVCQHVRDGSHYGTMAKKKKKLT